MNHATQYRFKKFLGTFIPGTLAAKFGQGKSLILNGTVNSIIAKLHYWAASNIVAYTVSNVSISLALKTRMATFFNTIYINSILNIIKHKRQIIPSLYTLHYVGQS